MNSNDFYQIVKEEGLDKYNIGDSKDSCWSCVKI